MLNITKRGVVIISNSNLSEDGTSLDYSGGVSGAAIRQYLTYWDEIHHVDPNFMKSMDLEHPDAKLLVSEGILKKGIINFPKDYHSDFSAWIAAKEVAQLEYYTQMRAQKNDIILSMAQTGNILKFPTRVNANQESLVEFSLLNCLPSPTKCRIEDLLEFKWKRKPELLAFRTRMDELVKSFGDLELSKDEILKTRDKITKAVFDINKLMDESKFQKVMNTMKTYMNLEENKAIGLAMGLIGGGIFQTIEGSAMLAGLGYLTNVGINLAIKKTDKMEGLPSETRDFAYLYHLNKELPFKA
jgi:hypothetical protein